MKKKWKWLILCAVILVIVFAPMPHPHFVTFTDVYNYEGQMEDVMIKIRFFHFKPLFLRYGNEFEGYSCLGSVKVYNHSGENIYTFKLNHDVSKIPNAEGFYFTMCSEHSMKDGKGRNHDGNLIWDENCRNIIVPVIFQTENFDAFSTTYTSVTYFCSKDGLSVDEIKALFYQFDSFFIPSYTETKYHPEPF